ELEQTRTTLEKEQEQRKRYATTVLEQRKKIQEKRGKIQALEEHIGGQEAHTITREEMIREAIETMHTYKDKRVIFIGGHTSDVEKASTKYLIPFGAQVEHVTYEEAEKAQRYEADLIILYTNFVGHNASDRLKNRLGLQPGKDYESFGTSKTLLPAKLVAWAHKHFTQRPALSTK
ncbi:MAG: hypothetical protein Q7R96_01980, partial [Nanoarchaeota archaeon]|nr:hypothetical protein [Nanoarchaeota archaeon]